ncbi:hypothetical protein GGI43DRAFT_431653 [Trichoderma evansii]
MNLLIRLSCCEDFKITIIYALLLKYNIVALLFNEFWDKDRDIFRRLAGDFNTYITGCISKYDVVLALLSHMGKANAASAAASMRSSYRAFKLVIVVGICGGVPNYIIQYNFSRNYPDSFICKNIEEDNLSEDKLFELSYCHKHCNLVACICSNCHGKKNLVYNKACMLLCNNLSTVTSGNTVMKSGEDRDRIAKKKGVIENLLCIVVKGVCDYADCYKNKPWQYFTAAVAASVLKSYFLVLFKRNLNFIRRETILSRLLEKIWPGVNKEDCQRTIIKGLGGVGKTQIALKAVLAVDATSFKNAYCNINKANVKQLVKAALGEESSGSWLLVVDNADNIDLLFGTTGLLLYLLFTVKLDILTENIFSIIEIASTNLLLVIKQALAYMAMKYILTLDYLELCELELKNIIDLLIVEYFKFMSILVEKDILKSLLLIALKIKVIEAIRTLQAYLEKERELEECIKFTVQRLDEVMPSLEHKNRVVWMKYLPHAQALLALLKLLEYFTGKEAEASLFSKMHQRALELRERALGKDHPNTLNNINNLEAEKIHWQTLELKEKALGKDYPNTLTSMGKYKKAEKIYQQTLELMEKVLGKHYPDTLTSINNLAQVLSNLGKYEEAEKMH